MNPLPFVCSHGWLNLYKSLGITSAQAVGKAKRLLRQLHGGKAPRIGHAGTLDPLADGVLPLAIGEATKLVSYAMGEQKSYRFTLQFCSQTTTDDREGEVIATRDGCPTMSQIQAILPEFLGNIQQVPPIYSALHVNGERAYDLARRGEIPELAPRTVRIDSLSIVSLDASTRQLVCDVTCGKGTYIRSLGRDIALKLNNVGHLATLTRTAVGPFSIDMTISLENLEEIVHKAASGELWDACGFLEMPSVLADIPVLEVTATQAEKLRTGQAIGISEPFPHSPVVVMFSGKIIALAQWHSGLLKVNRGFVYNP